MNFIFLFKLFIDQWFETIDFDWLIVQIVKLFAKFFFAIVYICKTFFFCQITFAFSINFCIRREILIVVCEFVYFDAIFNHFFHRIEIFFDEIEKSFKLANNDKKLCFASDIYTCSRKQINNFNEWQCMNRIVLITMLTRLCSKWSILTIIKYWLS